MESNNNNLDLDNNNQQWELEIKGLEELENLEKIFNNNINNELKTKYVTYLNHFSGFNRIPIYKMLNHLKFNINKLEEFYILLMKISKEHMLILMTFMETFIQFDLISLLLSILYRLQDNHIYELLFQITNDDAHYLIQILRHITSFDIDIFIELLSKLDFTTIIKLIKHCNEPTAKDCRLCRVKRLHELEYRIINNQIPSSTMKVPGTMPLYIGNSLERVTTEDWKADDEKGFTFNVTNGEIMWYKHPVDLIRICDKCLLDVNQAVTNHNRFEPIYHIQSTSERKESIRQLRDNELCQAEVIWKISKERTLRRTREFALKALETQRYGLKREAKERETLAMEKQRQDMLALKQTQHNLLVHNALLTDKKWLQVDRVADMKALDTRQLYAEVSHKLAYSLPDYTSTGELNLQAPDHRAPKLRQDPKSSKLSLIDPAGCRGTKHPVPIDPEGASKLFGTHLPVLINEDQQIKQWKDMAIQHENKYLKKLKDQEEADRIRKAKEHRELSSYIFDKLCELNENSEQRQIKAWNDEQQRILNRQYDRERRKEIRFQEYLLLEFKHMCFEDNRSYKLRDYDWQCKHEFNERDQMFNEELEQTEVDRFWGLDLFVRRQYEEEHRLRQLYENKVKELNTILVKTNAIQPYNHKCINYIPVGTLNEDIMYRKDENKRRDVIIKKLKSEEVRGKLKVRLFRGYL